jgi:hypothetical protein
MPGAGASIALTSSSIIQYCSLRTAALRHQGHGQPRRRAPWNTDHDLYINGVHHDLGYPASVELLNGDILTVFYAKERADRPAVIMQAVWGLER